MATDQHGVELAVGDRVRAAGAEWTIHQLYQPGNSAAKRPVDEVVLEQVDEQGTPTANLYCRADEVEKL